MPYAGAGFFLQRLFSTFPNGWPGSGILLQRVLTATTLFCCGIAHLKGTSQLASIIPHMFAAAAGVLLLVGLWTPIAGTMVAIVELWIVYSSAGGLGTPIMLATLGATLAMIGPGAWSVDAHLFGRKHFEIPQRQKASYYPKGGASVPPKR
jgi:putative oxidoreductase